MSSPPLDKDDKNFYHPSTEQEIVDLVKYAHDNNLQLRIRGSGHSFGRNIYTDVCKLNRIDIEASAPDGDNINIKLDKYTKILSVDKNQSRVTVEAGIHLGHDPADPLSTLENSLLYQLHHTYELTLNDLGGVTRQTVSGFLSTGSSGGSTTYSIEENVHALRIIDGTGEIYEVNKDANPDLFHAALVSLGLLGVISTVTFHCTDRFNIKGVQLSSVIHKSTVDIFNDDPSEPNRKGLTSFLTKTQYARILWWPQTSRIANLDNERLQVWQAERLPYSDDFKIIPFKLFECTELMMLYCFLMTLMGNIDDMDAVRRIIDDKKSQFQKLMTIELKEDGLNEIKAKATKERINAINQIIFNLVTGIGDQIPSEIREYILPVLSAAAMNILTSLDNHISFQDHAYLGLPMDNTADDILVPTMFTEIWVPLPFATKTTTLLRDYFASGPNRYSRTGNNAWELYAAKASSAWMSMSYSDGKDVWKDGAFRIDPFWFIHNKSKYLDIYRPIWIQLHDEKIPFRLHWGKIFPSVSDKEYKWREIMVQSQYPRLTNFLALRREKDPSGIFLSSFCRYWLGVD